MPLNFSHVKNVRRSPLYRVLQVLPTPARPWLMALETFTQLRERRMEKRFGRRENHLLKELDRAKGRRGGNGIGRMLLAAGLTYLASRLNDTKKAPIGSSRTTRAPGRETTAGRR